MSILPRVFVASLAFTAAGAFVGCATVGPDFKPLPVEAPARWSDWHGGDASLSAGDAAASPLPADRWAVFGDPDLSRLLATATQANQDVTTATLRVLQARVDETTVSAQRGIQVAGRAGVTRERQSETGSSSRLVNAIGGTSTPALLRVLSSPFSLYQAGFDASWEPDLWGRVLRAEESAKATGDAQEATLRQVMLSVRGEVARSYFSLRAAQRQRALVEDELAGARETQSLLAVQRDSGLDDESAVVRQRSQVASLQALLPSLLAQEAQALNQLTLLCGAKPGSLNEGLAARATGEPPIRLPDLRLGVPAELARHRPDVAAAEARLHAATADIAVAVADLYPRISLGASFGLESVGSSKFGDWGSRQWSLGPSLSIPVFDQGRRRATIELRKLQQQEAAVAFQQTVLKAWHEVDDAVSAFVAETDRGTRLAERVRNGQDEAVLSQARYANGLTTYLPVLSARAGLIDVQRDQADATARTQAALASLYKVLGDDDMAGTTGSPATVSPNAPEPRP